MTTLPQPSRLADKLDMQHRLFAELSRMFGQEVPLYDKSLAVNSVCNRVVCDLLAARHEGFHVTDEQMEKTSGERHGAIRIGREDEYRWIGRFFACFGMEPHNFYDMTSVGAKSQPVISTAFRSLVHPEHRVFTSLLRTDYFDGDTRRRIEERLAQRQVFSDRAKELIERSEREGGLSSADAGALIREAVERIFKWTGRARDHALYTHLCDAGFKIAADIACFEAHHLNHLTPNTFCMDLYTAAMKRCLGEIDESEFRIRAERALGRLAAAGDRDYLRLHFKHLTAEEILACEDTGAPTHAVPGLVDRLAATLRESDFDLTSFQHSGFKDYTEGPPDGVQVLLRQDAYKALTEPVHFVNNDGSELDTVHTARFGEIEQRFYATTPKGRELYDRCLAAADAERAQQQSMPFAEAEAARAAHFAPFPPTLPELLKQELVYGRYEPTAKGLAERESITTTDIRELVRLGYAVYEGLRYEDFLPISAAGIFASNLSQYGTRSTAAEKPTYTQATLEAVLGRPIIDADAVYRGIQALSLIHTYTELGVLNRVPPAERDRLGREAAGCPVEAAGQFGERAVVAARV